MRTCMNLTMSMTLRFPKAKAKALGGVATGSMKAREAAMVQGSITYSGCSLIAVAYETRRHNTVWRTGQEMRAQPMCVRVDVFLYSVYHWGQYGQEQGGGGCVAEALGECRHQQGEQQRDGIGRNILERWQAFSQPLGQTWLLETDAQGVLIF